jgi:hypothetical protein
MTHEKKIFLFLDDDAFRADKVRHPRVYYPLIGAHDILELADSCEVIKFTTVEGAQDYIEREGCPSFISFDNDLMRTLEGIDLAKWLVEQDMDNPGFIPAEFDFFVHSQNRIAKERIEGYLGQYLAIRRVAHGEPALA